MHAKLPSYISGHVAAFTGVVALHGGLIAWQMMPTPPVAIPQQQIIQIAMVAPSVPQVEPKPVIEEVQPEPTPKAPPKEVGMKKVQPEVKPKPVVKKPEPPKEIEVVEDVPPAPAQQTSGLQAADATLEHAALTEPVAADYLKNPPPVYPRRALSRRMQGTVMIEVRVSTVGQPLKVALESSSGYRLLDDAALDAVRKWKFVPAHRGSEVVEASVVVPVQFQIN